MSAAPTDPSGQKESRMKRKIVVALVATVVVASGVTASVLVVQHRAESARVAAEKAKEREAERERLAALAEKEAAHEECVAATADYLAAVQDVDAVVSVGVNLQDYGDLVRDAAMAQRRLGPVTPACQSGVVDPLDEAMAEYTDTASEWNDCIFDDDFSCDVDDLDLSTPWLAAGVALLGAEDFVSGTGGANA